jgi:hypothetical protein
MTARRIYATATLLHDGSVLVAGGNGRDAVSEGWLASAERYLPWTNSWVKAGYFRRPRGAQTATRLLDGHVLLGRRRLRRHLVLGDHRALREACRPVLTAPGSGAIISETGRDVGRACGIPVTASMVLSSTAVTTSSGSPEGDFQRAHLPNVKPSAQVIGRRLDDELVLVHLSTNRIYALNTTGARLWELLESGTTVEKVVETMLEEFEVDEAQLRGELAVLLAMLQQEELVDDCDLH